MEARFAREPPIHAFIVLPIAFGAFCATFLGGLAALRFQDRLHLILAFSAGTVIALAFFDLLPEALRLGGTQYSPQALLVATALGFFVYVVVDRFFSCAVTMRRAKNAAGRAQAVSRHTA